MAFKNGVSLTEVAKWAMIIVFGSYAVWSVHSILGTGLTSVVVFVGALFFFF